MRTVIIAGLLALTATLAYAEPEADTIRTEDLLDQMQDSFRKVADELFSSLVHIEAYKFVEGSPTGSGGSGFIVEHDAERNIFYVATNHHVAGGSYDYIQIHTRDGRSFDAELVGSDPRYDVALLAFEYSTDEFFDWSPSVSSIGDSDAVQAGDMVYAVGSPSNLPQTVTLGIVSNVSRETKDRVGEYIQTDTAINPGNSGGPLVSLRDGKVIGINTWISTYTGGSVGLGFAVPINVAMRIIGNLKEHGTPRHGYIGVEYSPRGATDVLAACPEEDAEDTEDLGFDDETWAMIIRSLATIMNVTPLAPADRHGLKPGDVIFLVDGEPAFVVTDIDRPVGRRTFYEDRLEVAAEVMLTVEPPRYSKLDRMVDALTPGADSTFEVIRDCDEVTITLQPGVRVEEDAGDLALASWPGMRLNIDLSVAAVAESGVAAGLAIQKGDVITHVNSDQIDNLGQFYRSIDTCRTERCSLGVYRNGILSWTPDFMVPRQ